MQHRKSVLSVLSPLLIDLFFSVLYFLPVFYSVKLIEEAKHMEFDQRRMSQIKIYLSKSHANVDLLFAFLQPWREIITMRD